MATGETKKSWKQRAKSLKAEGIALYYAYKDPRVPWYAKLIIAIVIGYALSPIDLIPDFIPFIGYLDDLVLIPLGITIAIKLIPPPVMEEAREKAKLLKSKPKKWLASAVIIAIWILVGGWLVITIFHWLKH